jgi:hypothetical protein
MDKLILVSILAATIVLPFAASRGRHPRRSVRKMLLAFLAFNALYVFLLITLYVRFFVPEYFH